MNKHDVEHFKDFCKDNMSYIIYVAVMASIVLANVFFTNNI